MGFLSSLLIFPALFSLVVGIPSVINNCSGTARPHLPNQIASAPGYAPQLPPYGDGWEQWVMVVESFVNKSDNPIFFARWGRGDFASPNSRLEDGIFTFFTSFDNGTSWGFAVNGTLEYSDVSGVKTWTLGDNKMIFDGNTGGWSHSMAHPGFSFQSHTDIPPPGTPFNPVMDGKTGLLRGQLYTRVEIPRGHIDGNVTYPWGQSYTGLKSLVTLKHSWSRKPMQHSVNSYVRGVTYLPETPSVQTVNWYQTSKDNKEIDTAQYTKQTGSLDLGQVYTLFQITNSPSDLKITTDSNLNSVLTFPGCPEQGGTPNLTWSTSYLRKRHSSTDVAGGVTSFHSVIVTVNQWFNGSWYPAVNTGLGFLETYQSPQAQ